MCLPWFVFIETLYTFNNLNSSDNDKMEAIKPQSTTPCRTQGLDFNFQYVRNLSASPSVQPNRSFPFMDADKIKTTTANAGVSTRVWWQATSISFIRLTPSETDHVRMHPATFLLCCGVSARTETHQKWICRYPDLPMTLSQTWWIHPWRQTCTQSSKKLTQLQISFIIMLTEIIKNMFCCCLKMQKTRSSIDINFRNLKMMVPPAEECSSEE